MGNIKRLFNAICWYIRRKYFPTKKEKLSKGEALITSWLRYSDCKFTPQYAVYLPELNTKTNTAYIDFMVNQHGHKTAIEFNGKQHYDYVPYFHKGGIADLVKQKHRDQVVKDWCLSNNIEFLEIPYTYSTDDIVNVLKEHFG